MADNKTQPTKADVHDFVQTLSESRAAEANSLIAIMSSISGDKPVMWGPSIIGFGTHHYKYESGREGDIPRIGFSPRKAAITIYFAEGFDRYAEQLNKLGKFKASVSCLYINSLKDINATILVEMLKRSYVLYAEPQAKVTTPEEYIARVPAAARLQFDELRTLVKDMLPNAKEVLSYGIIGYKIDDKRARVFVSGWKDHTAMYPVPKDPSLVNDLAPYIKGKGTLWFALDKPLPKQHIKRAVQDLIKETALLDKANNPSGNK
jgi:uncharacterized protein YdhG (YjbR/CyaY superfamily)